jgi:hypothetical protein
MLRALFTSDLRGGIHSPVPSFRLFWSSGSGRDPIFLGEAWRAGSVVGCFVMRPCLVACMISGIQDTFGSVLNWKAGKFDHFRRRFVSLPPDYDAPRFAISTTPESDQLVREHRCLTWVSSTNWRQDGGKKMSSELPTKIDNINTKIWNRS